MLSTSKFSLIIGLLIFFPALHYHFGLPTTPNLLPKPGGGSLALIKGGQFTMGDLFNDGDKDPRHLVTVSDFYLGKFEVTFEEFDAFCTATKRDQPADDGWGRGKRPVINIDWYDAVEYCNWLSQKQKLSPVYTIDKSRQDPQNLNQEDSKKWVVTVNYSAHGYRLPTEAEWEYAARERGKKVRFGNGLDEANADQMNFDASKNKKQKYSVVGKNRQQTVAIDSLNSPNALGLYAMSGNVAEWCADWFGPYEMTTQTNPTGPASGELKVLRGGSWIYPAGFCRAASRISFLATWRKNFLGFRVALSK